MQAIGTILGRALPETAENPRTALPLRSIADLDLTTLPARLDDATLAMVQEIADSPLCRPEPCSERHLGQCLRVMQAVLPKRNADEITGELFVAAYIKKLLPYPQDQISYLADQAMERCKWFPTIAECIEIMAGWRRVDDATQRQALASRLAANERHERRREAPATRWPRPAFTQATVDALPDPLVSIGLGCGALVKDASGKIVPAPEPDDAA